MNILKEFLIETKPHSVNLPGHIRHIYKFPNGYGASVIEGHLFYTDETHPYELAVVKFDNYNNDDDEFYITYTTPITDDVLGYLDGVELLITLEKIKELPHA